MSEKITILKKGTTNFLLQKAYNFLNKYNFFFYKFIRYLITERI